MTKDIKIEAMTPEAMRGLVETFYAEPRALIFDPSKPPGDFTVTRESHPVHVFRLATQDIRVAFDERTRTLYIGETGEGGWMLRQAMRETEMGRQPYPFQREVKRAMDAAHYAHSRAESAKAEQYRHARMVAKAAELLRSRKSGVRRRAKRLLEKLAK